MSDTVDTPVEIVEELNDENSLPSLRPHPGAIMAILSVALAAQTDQPGQTKEDLNFAIYHTTKQFAKSQSKSENNSEVETIVFLHYIEACRAAVFMQDRESTTVKVEPTDPKYMRAYADAALSLFDIYLTDPRDRVVRRVLVKSAEALFEVVAAHQARNEDQSPQDMMGNMATIALLVKTLAMYLRGSRRTKNLEYIAWLKTFFEQAIATTDLSFMRDDVITKSVMTQVMKGTPVIVIPNA